MEKIAWLALAGALGTLSRYGLGGLVQRLSGGTFPWGTWAVNGLGCFLFGLVWTLAEERFLLSAGLRVLMLTGFMGAFTTFSTYMFETSQLLGASQWMWAAANFLGQNALGFLVLMLGSWLARSI